MDRSFVSTCYSDNHSSDQYEQNFITNNTLPNSYMQTSNFRNTIVLKNIIPLYKRQIQRFPYQINVNQANNSQQSVIRSPDKNKRSPSPSKFQEMQKFQQREKQQKVLNRIQNTLEFFVKQQKERDARQEARLLKQQEILLRLEETNVKIINLLNQIIQKINK